jgi:hypothetical protein
MVKKSVSRKMRSTKRTKQRVSTRKPKRTTKKQRKRSTRKRTTRKQRKVMKGGALTMDLTMDVINDLITLNCDTDSADILEYFTLRCDISNQNTIFNDILEQLSELKKLKTFKKLKEPQNIFLCLIVIYNNKFKDPLPINVENMKQDLTTRINIIINKNPPKTSLEVIDGIKLAAVNKIKKQHLQTHMGEINKNLKSLETNAAVHNLTSSYTDSNAYNIIIQALQQEFRNVQTQWKKV